MASDHEIYLIARGLELKVIPITWYLFVAVS
ncbi:hypothetical protein J2S06_003151 [Bacillus alveayuensis]|uniref:Uncharacterized protein n=1 Tax=Aeribacillus alveayuensis TaxID=279215 RepID=A0ABT9VSQ1_9BACI|nr:hypothetical protein [Bacillus alveayuensis]